MFRTLLIATLLVARCFAAKLEVELAPETLVMNRLNAGLVGARKRQAAIRSLFEEAGCPVTEQPIDKHSGNVLCTLPGESKSTIVIGGHFDYVDMGRGIVDDWSGAALLVSLYQALKSQPRQHTYVFAAFAEEERGLAGSSYFVKKLPDDQRNLVRAFVNLECLGLTPPKVWLHRATPVLAARLLDVAKAINIPLQSVDVDQVGDDDTHPFLDAKMPVITIHSLTRETFRVIHSNRDSTEAISQENYYNAYKLVAYYLAYLDVKTE